MLRTNALLFGMLVFVFSCGQDAKKGSKRLVLRFDDSVRIFYNIPVFIDNKKYTYLAKENFLDNHVELFLSDTVDLANLNSFELKRLDYFGSVGLHINHTDNNIGYRNGDTVLVISELKYEGISSSNLDTTDVISIIEAFQEVGKKLSGDSIR